MRRCYGELMAEAAGDGHDSPEAAASARRAAAAEHLAEEYSDHLPPAAPADTGEPSDE